MKVVQRAIKTMTEKVLVVKIPAFKPTFNTISSTNPLVFINAPTTDASRSGNPDNHPAPVHPVNLLTDAKTITRINTPPSCPVEMEVTSVLIPDKAKYNGSVNVNTNVSIYSRH